VKRKILIVDDEIGIRLLLEDLLGSEGFQVHTAQNGKEALEMITKHKMDLMMIDYKLPMMDGIEVVKQLEKEGNHIPTIIMSGLTENFKDHTYELTSVVKVLSKPFDVLAVRDYVKEILAD
jgi:two-component system, response regulator, stage 0 sporulation protein F